jgi:NAD(P)-dependent dehydrogenase (short-subunit alcohol dehydrogenase family)
VVSGDVARLSVANAALFHSSNEASYVTGAELWVDEVT